VKPVALLTDFGLVDHYVGVMHAVLVREAPGVERIDLGHGIPAGDVWAASFALGCAWPHLPSGAVVLAVVDPGVGTARRAVAAGVGERFLVAPDNGLAAAVGDPGEVVLLEPERLGLPRPSATFHGRDLFAPAAARLARGEALETLGEPFPPRSLVPCPLPRPERSGDGWRATVLSIDRFGNVVTNLPAAELEGDVVVQGVSASPLRRVGTYGDAGGGEVVSLTGSSGMLELAVNRGSAAAVLDVTRGQAMELRPAGR
jgi:S-adenosylmethionine hydrolase